MRQDSSQSMMVHNTQYVAINYEFFYSKNTFFERSWKNIQWKRIYLLQLLAILCRLQVQMLVFFKLNNQNHSLVYLIYHALLPSDVSVIPKAQFCRTIDDVIWSN